MTLIGASRNLLPSFIFLSFLKSLYKFPILGVSFVKIVDKYCRRFTNTNFIYFFSHFDCRLG